MANLPQLPHQALSIPVPIKSLGDKLQRFFNARSPSREPTNSDKALRNSEKNTRH